MEYNKLVSITGLSGLFELVSSKTDGGIVRSLEDKSTKFISNRLHSFSHLESIEIYTIRENVNLVEIFDAMKTSTEKVPDSKADVKVLKSYFGKIYPDMDFIRVYTSDMKKIVKWYEIITANNIEIKLSAVPEQEASVAQETTAAKPKATAETRQAAVKSAPPKKINTPRKMA